MSPMPHLKEVIQDHKYIFYFFFSWEHTNWCPAFMRPVPICLRANPGIMLWKLFLPVSSYPYKVLRRNSVVLFFLTERTQSGQPAGSSDTWTIFLPFVFHSRTIPHLLQCSRDCFNHLIYRRMYLFFNKLVTYEWQNMLVGTYPVAEHYRDCGKDLDCDTWVRKSSC